MVIYMVLSKKIIKYLIIILIFIVCIIFTFRLVKKNNFKNLNIKYVNEIQSELYEKVTLYKFNNEYSQYDLVIDYVDKDNFVNYIFNYYYEDSIYVLKDYKLDKENVIIEIDNINNVNVNDFKLIKLSFLSLNFKKVSIKCNERIYKL